MTPLVQARGLGKTFAGRVQALRGVDIALARGEALGVVGESGSGKSTLGRLLLGLLPASSGEVMFDGTRLDRATRREWRALRARMQIVFQDPFASLDPRRRVGGQITDGLAIHGLDPGRHRERLEALLAQVGLDPGHAQRFPHEFSGGQRQRIGIARALATNPEFLVTDEPVSALDVSIQAQIVRLLAELRGRMNLAMLFISHDLLVVRHLCDRVMVLYLGRVMEEGPTARVFGAPAHPYTRALISATPRLDPARRQARILLPGEPPSPTDPPSGCVFRTRCPHAVEACAREVPDLRDFRGARVACIRAEHLNGD